MPCSPRILASIDKDLASADERTRWQAAIALGEFVGSDPEQIWPLIIKHGSRRHADARMAVATCVLEHLLEHHFVAFFPRVAQVARKSRWFGQTFLWCWAMGEAESRRNMERWRRLERELDRDPRGQPMSGK